jgi:predicted AlkP superfamily phosphohydrolase/phosphomutase
LKKKFALIVAGALVLLLVLLQLLVSKKPDTSEFPRVILLGIDGAGWEFIRPMIKEGRLPHFKSLMEEGSCGVLKTLQPAKSPVVWTSIATGKSMLKHGILDWAFPDRGGRLVPYGQSERRVKAFWNILTDRRRTVGVINWFLTHPAERVNGFLLSDMFPKTGRADFADDGLTFPRSLLKTLEKAAPNDAQRIYREENLPDYRKIIGRGKRIFRYPSFVLEDKTVETAALDLIDRYPVEVLAVYFHLVDVVNHFVYRGIDRALLQKGRDEEKTAGGISADTREALDKACSRLLEPVYGYADKILGEFLARLKPGATIIVCSDHSFTFQDGAYMHVMARQPPHGILLIRGPHIRKNHEIAEATVFDILPTLLYAIGLPTAQDMDGRVLTDVFDQEYLNRKPVELIRSYEDGKRRKPSERNSAADEKLLEEFKALGYIK